MKTRSSVFSKSAPQLDGKPNHQRHSLASLLRWSLIIFLLWFIPWVWSFYFGFIVYFPYEPSGQERFVRATGPLIHWFDQDHAWVGKKQIPKACARALVAAEDAHFYEHYGIDLESIEQAFEKNEKRGTKKWGASTITQQLVKNAFLSRKRSYVRKTREIIGALILDVIMSKENQIVWYFNIVEFGPSVYGLSEAARYYYGKAARDLSMAECVSLVSLLPSPNRTGRLLKQGTSSPAHARRSAHIMRALSRADDVPKKSQFAP